MTSFVVERPLPEHAGFCLLVHGFLTADECAAHIEAAERRGFATAETDYPPTYRNNERQVHDDDALARALFTRARAIVPASLEGATEPLSVNPRFRLCRYTAGQRFHIHQDGVRHVDACIRSRLTFMIYLTDGSEFEGGDTVFYAGPPRASAAPEVLGRIRPRVGSLIVFDHALWHAGDTVTRGIKHVLRSELLYAHAPSIAASHTHAGYVFALEKLADGRVASGGRDGTVRIEGEVLGTHTQCVIGLAALSQTRLASVSRDRSLVVWDVARRTEMHSARAHEGAVLCVARVDAHVLATGGADHEIGLFDHEAKAIARLRGHRGWVVSLAALGGTRLVSASEDGAIIVWDVQRAEPVSRFETGIPQRSLSVLGEHIACGDFEGNVTLYAFRDGAIAPTSSWRAHDAQVRRVRFLGEGMLATVGEDDAARVWSFADGRRLASFEAAGFVTDVVRLDADRLRISGYEGGVRDVSLRSGDERAVA